MTAVHKANIMKYSDGLYLHTRAEVAKEYPDIEFEDRIVDNMCMQLVQKPELYDVLVLPNLYGDIVSDLAAGLVGGLGVAPGANIGPGGAVFEATHGRPPKYKGQNKVNPTALILSGMLMLRHLGEMDAGNRLENAVADVIKEGKNVTYDLKADRNDPRRRRHPRNGPSDLREAKIESAILAGGESRFSAALLCLRDAFCFWRCGVVGLPGDSATVFKLASPFSKSGSRRSCRSPSAELTAISHRAVPRRTCSR